MAIPAEYILTGTTFNYSTTLPATESLADFKAGAVTYTKLSGATILGERGETQTTAMSKPLDTGKDRVYTTSTNRGQQSVKVLIDPRSTAQTGIEAYANRHGTAGLLGIKIQYSLETAGGPKMDEYFLATVQDFVRGEVNPEMDEPWTLTFMMNICSDVFQDIPALS